MRAVGFLALCWAATAQSQPTCLTVRCQAGYVCHDDGRSPSGTCVPDKNLALGDPCEHNREFFGVCPEGTVCRPLDGVATLVSESRCQEPKAEEPKLTCASILCIATTKCVETATGPQCLPIDSEPKPCVAADGTIVRDGESYKPDCNTCSCRNGMFLCTLMACPKPPVNETKSCVLHDGTVVADGESVKEDCNTCSCKGGMLACTRMMCPKPVYLPEGTVCEQNGNVLGKCELGLECRTRNSVVGQAVESLCLKPEGLSCAVVDCFGGFTCVETTDGPKCVPVEEPKPTCASTLCIATTKCVETATGPQCLPIDMEPKPCVAADGTIVRDGESYKPDCNTCSCSNGRFLCPEMACPKPPVNETKSCVLHDGTVVADGENIKQDCNTCSCKGGMLACTVMLCPDPRPAYIPEGQVCEQNGNVLGKCELGLECRPRSSAAGQAVEMLCLKPEGLSCDVVDCFDGFTCVETTDGPKCVPADKPKLTCASIFCIATTRCVETATGPQCIPIDMEPKPCVARDGTIVRDGESYKPDCNTCSCRNGMFLCTRMACPKPPVKSCVLHDGTVVADGENIKQDCNTCSCKGGMLACTMMLCPEKPKPTGCLAPNGELVPEGARHMVDCNRCFCKNGMLACTKMMCPGKPNPTGCVTPNGDVVPEGKSFKDDCNTCTCMNGGISCTEMACAEPKSCLEGDIMYRHGDKMEYACQTCVCMDGDIKCVDREDCEGKLDCTWDENTPAPWSRSKRARCCSEQGVRCPTDLDAKKKCEQVKDRNSTMAAACCEKFNMKCPMKYDCDTETADQVKMDWCCTWENKLCPIDCAGPALLSKTAADECCMVKGLGCWAVDPVVPKPVPKTERKQSKGVLYRLKIKGSVEDLMENPKVFMRKLRMSLLRASKITKQTSQLVVTAVGALMAGFVMPPADMWDRWAFDVEGWYKGMEGEEESILTEYAREGHAMGGAGGVAADGGVFAEYYFENNDAASKDVADALKMALNGEGPLAENTNGYSMIMQPVADGQTAVDDEQEEKHDDATTSKTLLYSLIAAGGALCMGSAIALAVYNQKKRTYIDADDLYSHMKVTDIEEKSPDMDVDSACAL